MWLILHDEAFIITGPSSVIIILLFAYCLLNPVRNGHPYTGFNYKN